MIIYLFSTFAIFYSFIIVKPSHVKAINLLDFKNYSSVNLINPTLVSLVSLNFLSMAGIPPFAGFLSKFLIFVSVLEFQSLLLIFSLILVSLFSAYYYIRPIKLLLFHDKKTPSFLVEITSWSSFILIIITFFNIFLLCQPQILCIYSEVILRSFY